MIMMMIIIIIIIMTNSNEDKSCDVADGTGTRLDRCPPEIQSAAGVSSAPSSMGS